MFNVADYATVFSSVGLMHSVDTRRSVSSLDLIKTAFALVEIERDLTWSALKARDFLVSLNSDKYKSGLTLRHLASTVTLPNYTTYSLEDVCAADEYTSILDLVDWFRHIDLIQSSFDIVLSEAASRGINTVLTMLDVTKPVTLATASQILSLRSEASESPMCDGLEEDAHTCGTACGGSDD